MKKTSFYPALAMASFFTLFCGPAFSTPINEPAKLAELAELEKNLATPPPTPPDNQNALSSLTHNPRPKLETLDNILCAFTDGLSPNLNDQEQKKAFEVYRCMKFGNPLTHLNNDDILGEIARAIEANPGLDKPVFRNYQLRVTNTATPITPELMAFSKSYRLRISDTLRDLFQMETKPRVWKKILQYVEPSVAPATEPDKIKAAKKRAQADWNAFFESKIPSSFNKMMKDSAVPLRERAKSLFQNLNTQRNALKAEGQDVSAVSRALVDIIHAVAHQSRELQTLLKTGDGKKVLQALQQGLALRDEFATELGFKGGFQEASQTFDGMSPTGITSESLHLEKLKSLQQGVTEASQKATISAQASHALQEEGLFKRVRHLSLEESPLRSCLGGDDCSSRTYLLKALDPNFHYFTLTDNKGASSGHVTLVLGDGTQKNRAVKIAFIDKIQNIPHSELGPMLEGIRQSVLEQDYILALPDDLGDHLGLSNSGKTRNFVQTHIPVEHNPELRLLEFTPHWNPYQFENRFSRAYETLPCSPLAPFEISPEVRLVPGKLNLRWKNNKLDMSGPIQEVFALKTSPQPEDRLRYIPPMRAFRLAKIENDPAFLSVLENWLKDPEQPIQIRKQALLHHWIYEKQRLVDLLNFFPRNEQVMIIQNFLDTPRHKDKIIQERERFSRILVHFRSNAKVRTALLNARLTPSLSGYLSALSEFILDNPEIPDHRATELIETLLNPESFDLNNINNLFALLGKIQPAGGSDALGDTSLSTFINHLNEGAALGRALAKGLTSTNEFERGWSNQLLTLEEGASGTSETSRILAPFKEIISLAAPHGGSFNFVEAAQSWLKSENTSPDPFYKKKTDFLLSNLGTENGLFELFSNSIPAHQWEAIEAKLDQTSFLFTLEKLLYSDAEKQTLFNSAKYESFEFVSLRLPAAPNLSPETQEGKTQSFQIQKTPVTRRQWHTVMGRNLRVTLLNQYGELIGLNPDQPMLNVSVNSAEEFIKRLNMTEDGYHYRLPTAEEWEYAASAGTQTAYSFGDDAAELATYGWFEVNSDFHPHPVASKKANPFGLYDTCGNVVEFTQTAASVDDLPYRDRLEHFIVTKGCSYGSPAHLCPTAASGRMEVSEMSMEAGFRLVRTPVLQ